MDYYILTHHNKQNLQGQSPKENILTLKDHNSIIKNIGRKDYIYQKKPFSIRLCRQPDIHPGQMIFIL